MANLDLLSEHTAPQPGVQCPDVPFFRPSIEEQEIEAVVSCLQSGWLTSGPRVKEFEAAFADFVGASHAVALNSCTAALHLAVEALGLRAGQAVLVPTVTFAATAEVVRYQGAIPVLVDCDPVTLNMDLNDAEKKLSEIRAGTSIIGSPSVTGIMPVHVGGLMLDTAAVHEFAQRNDLWVVEDAAHALPAAIISETGDLIRCGEQTADITCFSFYANKTITTGEGGMAVTSDARLADRMRQMSLHGLSHDAWNRFTRNGSWDYHIMAPGYKYNMTDIAASLGLHQLSRAEAMRQARETIAHAYRDALLNRDEIELPPSPVDRLHAWHLFPLRLRLDRLSADRGEFLNALRENGIGYSVHWRPLHLHPYYAETFGWMPQHLPVATAVWEQLISLPIYPGMTAIEQERVIDVISELCVRFAKSTARPAKAK